MGGNWCEQFFDEDYMLSVQVAALSWREQLKDTTDKTKLITAGMDHFENLVKRWQSLIDSNFDLDTTYTHGNLPKWCDDAMWLMAVADEASAGIGFYKNRSKMNFEEENPFFIAWGQEYACRELVTALRHKEFSTHITDDKLVELLNDLFLDSSAYMNSINDRDVLLARLEQKLRLPFLPFSLCQLVPVSEVCVQPKTRTSSVGCTLRSLSHHFALLPPANQVQTLWRVANRHQHEKTNDLDPQALNLLLIPFPYSISGNCFTAGDACVGSKKELWHNTDANKSRFFHLDQRWLRYKNGKKTEVAIQPIEFAKFIIELIEISTQEASAIHGVILPELALSYELAKGVADELRKSGQIEIFITGALESANARHGPQNSVFTSIIKPQYDYGENLNDFTSSWVQAKHHRWKVEQHQIKRYHLGGKLDPHFDWWEHIDISNRQCYFGEFRHRASIAALVCEDLARIDPVQTAIRAIGPNLVVALLMDGPQLENRWSGRYATVLADDPGSAVLTLTSLGLLKRSNLPITAPMSQIALWKEAGGETIDLSIPSDHHAMILTLSYKSGENYTIDGRRDVTRTVSLSRSGLFPIKHPKPPIWAK